MQSEEIDILMKDKTDFHKRLKLIAALKERTDGQSIEALQYLLKHDGVYKVRLAAWKVLSEKGVQCAEPVARPAYAIFLEKSIRKLKRFGVWLVDITEGFR
ncbi:hypothetical protein [Pantoea rwandensis]|nr:hypothetical protein [Pantoea rwandensis]